MTLHEYSGLEAGHMSVTLDRGSKHVPLDGDTSGFASYVFPHLTALDALCANIAALKVVAKRRKDGVY